MEKIFKYAEFLIESKEIEFNVKNKDDNFLNELISSLSFTFKKRVSRYFRPIQIDGEMGEYIDLSIKCTYKYEIRIKYDGELKVFINNELIYHNDIDKSLIINKVTKLIIKDLNENKFSVQNREI